MSVARTHEATLANMQQFSGDASSISHVSRSRRTHEPSGRREEAPTCAKCGRHHAPTDRCPAEGSRCNACGKLNHWQRVCRQATGWTSGAGGRPHSSGRPRSRARSRRRTNRDERQRGGVHSISQDARFDQLSDNFEPLAFNTVNINAVERDEVYTTLRITLKDRPDTPATLRVKVDTGAQGNVMPLRTFQRMYPSNIDTEGIPVRGSLEHRDTILTAYNGQLIRQYGTTRLKCVHETTTHEAEFFVADTPGPVILGLPSNGFIERQVQTVKYTLKKAAMSRSNPQKALLAFRSTPIDSHLPSPAEMLNARKYKSNLPVIIRNEHWSKDEIRRRLAERQEIQRLNHDKRAMQPLAPLIPGQDVRVRDTQTDTWQPAKVISTDVQPRSYNVLTPTGNVFRRNRRHLRETTERHTFQQDNVDDTDDLTRRDDM